MVQDSHNRTLAIPLIKLFIIGITNSAGLPLDTLPHRKALKAPPNLAEG